MRVLHITTGLSNGGAEGVLYRLCAYDRACIHVVVSLMDEGKYGPLLKDAGIEVECLGLRRGTISLPAIRDLARIVKREQADVVQTWMYHGDFIGGLVARAASSSPVYWGIRNSDLRVGRSRATTITIAYACGALSRVIPRRIISCAHSAVDVHVGMGYDRSKFVVVPNGFDGEQFGVNEASGLEVREQWKVGAEELLIGAVGRFDPQKDHRNLLQAVRKVVSRGVRVRLALVGNGLTEENAAIVGLVRECGVSSQTILAGPRSDIPAVMNALDIHVLASSYGEAFPNVVAEGMACGTPSVVTDVGDSRAVVGKYGWVVSPRDSDALADAISEACEARSDSVSWTLRRQLCRERVLTQFGIEKMIRGFHEAWASGSATNGRRA